MISNAAQADYSYPNPSGAPGVVLVYRHKACKRTHFTRLAPGDDVALTFPPCGLAGAEEPMIIYPPEPEFQLSEAPREQWRKDFERERRRARGGRPPKREREVVTANVA